MDWRIELEMEIVNGFVLGVGDYENKVYSELQLKTELELDLGMEHGIEIGYGSGNRMEKVIVKRTREEFTFFM